MNASKNMQNTITRYTLKEENLVGLVKEAAKNYDLLSAVTICLGNPEDKNYRGILKLLEVLLSTSIRPNEKKRILIEEFEIEMSSKLEGEVPHMCNISQGIEDRGMVLNKAEKKACSKQELTLLQALMDKLKWTMEQAMDALQIPMEDRDNLAAMIKSK